MKVTREQFKKELDYYLDFCQKEPIEIVKENQVIATLKCVNEEHRCRAPRLFANEQIQFRTFDTEEAYDTKEMFDNGPMAMTYEAYCSFKNKNEGRYEYIDGYVYYLASQSLVHQRILDQVFKQLSDYRKHTPDCRCDVYQSPVDVTLLRNDNKSLINVVQPDILVVADMMTGSGKTVRTPALIVEVLSPKEVVKDCMTKFDLYRESGVKEYLIFDNKSRQVQQFVFSDYQVVEGRSLSVEEQFISRVFKGFECSVKSFFDL